MKPAEAEEEFRAFVAARVEPLRRTAFLLCRDWHLAVPGLASRGRPRLDHVGKPYRHWRRVSAAGSVDAYVRGVLTHAWMDEVRRPWRREEPPTPDVATSDGVASRLDVLDLLAQLPPRRRAVVVLRFYCDLSVAETAQILGLAEGTVKSQAARARRASTTDNPGGRGRPARDHPGRRRSGRALGPVPRSTSRVPLRCGTMAP